MNMPKRTAKGAALWTGRVLLYLLYFAVMTAVGLAAVALIFTAGCAYADSYDQARYSSKWDDEDYRDYLEREAYLREQYEKDQSFFDRNDGKIHSDYVYEDDIASSDYNWE